MENGFYPDAVSRRYYALLHLMVDLIADKVSKYERRHDIIRKHFVENFYPEESWYDMKNYIYELFISEILMNNTA